MKIAIVVCSGRPLVDLCPGFRFFVLLFFTVCVSLSAETVPLQLPFAKLERPDGNPQSSFATTAIEALHRQLSGFPAEKVFVRTDRAAYTAGDTLWLKAWVAHASLLTPSTFSARLCLELIDPAGTVTERKICRIEHGEAVANFVLPEGVEERSLFRIRAYTPRMSYFDPGYRYTFSFPVLSRAAAGEVKVVNNRILPQGAPLWEQPQLTKRQIENATAEERERAAAEERAWLEAKEAGRDSRLKEIDLQFLPEGGNWVEGLPCRMAFKALARDGFGVEVEGKIVDNEGNEWITFASGRKGMGSFLFTPMAGRTYTAVLFNGQKIALPVPKSTGLTFQFGKAVNDTLDLRIFASQNIVSQGGMVLELLGQIRGAYCLSMPLRIEKAGSRFKIPLQAFAGGVARFSFFTQQGNVVGERLVWIDRPDRLQLTVSTSVANDTSGGRIMTLKVRSQDLQGKPLPAALCVAVTDGSRAPLPPEQESLPTRMLLTSDLQGEIEEPGWYFERETQGEKSAGLIPERAAALDLVLLTHGWRGFSWETLAQKREENFPDLWPLNSYIAGRVSTAFNKKIEQSKVTLFAKDTRGNTQMDDVLTGSDGRFAFKNLYFEEMGTLRLQALNAKGRAFNVGIELDSIPEVPIPPVQPVAQRLDRSFLDSLMLSFRAAKLQGKRDLDSLSRLQGIAWIDEIEISGMQKVKQLFGRDRAGLFIDQAIVEKKYDPNSTLLQVLQKEIPGFNVKEKLMEQEDEDAADERARNKNQFDIYRGQVRLSGPVPLKGLTSSSKIQFQDYAINTTVAEIYIDGRWINEWDESYIEFVKLSLKQGLDERHQDYWERQRVLYTDAYRELFRWHTEALESVPAIEVSGILVDVAQERGAVIQVKTRSGKGYNTKSIPGVLFARMRGYMVPDTFYTPRYYPKLAIDQLEYDFRNTYLWKPEVITNSQGEAELSFPVGFWSGRSLQIVVEGTDRAGGVGMVRFAQMVNGEW
ncbi:MAG: hypothetical protein AB7C90_02030 [Bacteroidales bacterium]